MNNTKIGVLTGGGDAPGLNAVIRAIVMEAKKYGYSVIGIRDGWAGLINGIIQSLDINQAEEIIKEGGTILGTSRTNPFKDPQDAQKVKETFNGLGLNALITIGGEDTLSVAKKFFEMGIPTVGIPKTIDNDVNGTDYTFGFDTAVSRATQALDNLACTAKSHHRVLIVEIMGRHTGWLTLYSGVAGGAHIILIPEKPISIDQVCKVIMRRYRYKKNWAMVALAEGYYDPIFAFKIKEAEEVMKNLSELSEKDKEILKRYIPKVKYDAFDHPQLGGIAGIFAQEIENRLKKSIESFMPAKFQFEVRTASLGHLLRGGSPTPFDRLLGTRFGLKAVELVHRKNFGKVTALKGTKIVPISFEAAVGTLKKVPNSIYEEMKVLLNRD